MEVNYLRTNRRAQIGNITIPLLKGEQGEQGEQGYSISRIQKTAGDGTPGTVDTYTIYINTDPETEIGVFYVTNGASGDMTKAVYDINNDGIVDKATADKEGNDIYTTYATKASVTTNTNAIASNSDRITVNEGAIASNTQAIQANTTAISNNADTITINSNAITNLSGRITTNANAISDNTTAISNQSNLISANTSAISNTTRRVSDVETTVSGYSDRISTLENAGYITKAVSDLTNYYTKSQTYTKQETIALCDAIPKFSIEVVNSLPTQDISETTIYLVRNTSQQDDLYTEYIYVNNTWEILGAQSVDLSNYYTKSEIDDMIGDIETLLASI